MKLIRQHKEMKCTRTYKHVNSSNNGRNERPLSPLAHRFQLIEDEETGWGKNIHQLMGCYKQHGDKDFMLDDIRKTDLTRLQNYPKTTFRVGPLHLSKPIEGLEEGHYCLFNWKFTFKNKANPCEIEVNESKPIVFVNPKDIVEAISNYEKEKQNTGKTDAEKSINRKQSDVSVLLYDLLHEANQYCGRTVDVQFNLTDKYLSFQHTGRALSATALMQICGLGEINYNAQEVGISYHCHGLPEFICSNRHTIVISNGFMVSLHSKGRKISCEWIEKNNLSREMKISLARSKRFTETIFLPFENGDNGTLNNYKVGLHCVFDDVQNIAFFANIGKVAVKIKGDKTKILDRKDWVVSKEYMTFVPKDMRDKDSEKKSTGVMFACPSKGNELLREDDAPAYNLLPTTSSFGFPFLMQVDAHVNKTNFSINHRDAWNKVYAELAGRLFAKWIKDLTLKAEYTPESIYNVVPKFEECIQLHPEENFFIQRFQNGFKEIILGENKKKKETAPLSHNKELGESVSAKGQTYIIDTNIFVNCPNILSKMSKDDTVILSAKVVDELDNLKYKLEDKDLRNVQRALKYINLSIGKANVHMEMSDIRLLPRDFDRHNPDNNILSVVMRHKSVHPTLLTSDNGLQIKAKAIGINVIGLKDFLASKRLFIRK